VAVAGLQSDVWPNLRLRDTLMGAGELADVRDGTVGADDYAERRRAVMDDELRMCALAVSRARASLVVATVAAVDDQPSAFVDLISPRESAVGWEATPVPPPLDLRGAVARARSSLVGRAKDGEISADDADARVLGILASLRVQGASPDEWAGVAPSSNQAPLYAPGAIVTLSPSRIETLDTCPLRWALESAGGQRAFGASASLGTLIHKLAEDFPQAGPEEMLGHLEERWDSLGLQPGYSTELLHRRARDMARLLGGYLRSHPDPLARETRISQVVEGIRISGIIDRVEAVNEDGVVRIVDFKTGKTPPTKKATLTNAQLGVYQAAVNEGALDELGDGLRAEGADLVYLSKATKSAATVLSQPALEYSEDPGWVGDLLERCRRAVSASTFTAVVNPGCRTCPVLGCCPAHDEGRQVTA
jgi:RecB family exonuclease